MKLYLGIYLIGLVVCLGLTWHAAENEPTAHGQGVILPIGCLFAVFWPVALVYFAIIAVVIAIQKLCR